MSTPSWARSTAASRQKESPHRRDYVPTRQPTAGPVRKPTFARCFAGTGLFGLPCEIRLEIYKMVFSSYADTELHDQHTIYVTHSFRSPEAALLQVSRTTRREASEIFYTTSRFVAIAMNFSFTKVIQWLELLGPSNQRHLVRNPHLEIIVLCGSRVSYLSSDQSEPFYPSALETKRPRPEWLKAWIDYSGGEERSKIDWHYDMSLGWEPRQLRPWFRRFAPWLRAVISSDPNPEAEKIIDFVRRVEAAFDVVEWDSQAESSWFVGWVVYEPVRQ